MGTTVSQLDGPPNVPRPISVYGYCVRACAGAAKVSAGTIATAISTARRLLMVVALSRWLVRCEATELRRRSRGMPSRLRPGLRPPGRDPPGKRLQLLHPEAGAGDAAHGDLFLPVRGPVQRFWSAWAVWPQRQAPPADRCRAGCGHR